MIENQAEQSPNVTTAQEIGGLYPTYMYMIRAFVSEGIIKADEPNDKQKAWARGAAMGNTGFEQVIGQLAQLTKDAHTGRCLEGMPMLIDLDTPLNQDSKGFDSIQRLHFCRLLMRDFKFHEQNTSQSPVPGVHPVLSVNQD